MDNQTTSRRNAHTVTSSLGGLKLLDTLSGQCCGNGQGLVLHDVFVGRSTLLDRYISGSYHFMETTIGACARTKRITVGEKTYHLIIYDMQGHERIRGLASLYYCNASAAIITYSVTSQNTMDVAKSLVTEILDKGPIHIVLALVGCKCDEEEREVKEKDAREYAEEIGAMYFETSAKMNTNVTELFNDVVLRVGKKADEREAASQKAYEASIAGKKKGSCELYTNIK